MSDTALLSHRGPAAIGWILGLLVLAGCEGESLSMGEWRQVGIRQAPISALRGDARIELLEAGTGRTVEAGDLVKIRVTVTQRVNQDVTKFDPVVAWLWTGREPEPRTFESVSQWGDLGSARIRQALIARRIGDRFQFALSAGAKGEEILAKNGFAAADAYAPYERGEPIGSYKWPRFVVGRPPYEWSEVHSEVEVLNACPGSLYRRTAVLRQRGAIFNMFEMSYRSEREGTLRWSALEASCPGPDNKVRLEVGPLYYLRGREARMLFNWSDSYHRLRPAGERS